jgi:hypothetical protein
MPPQDFHYKYTVQKGLFMQSEDSTDDTKFDFVQTLHPDEKQPAQLTHSRRSRTSV